MRAAGHLLVDRLERGGMHMHDELAITRDWLRKWPASRWFPELVNDDSIHN
jgi:hypothetical protein